MRQDAISIWIQAYEDIWRANDLEALKTIFSTDMRYVETPWSEPIKGLEKLAEYWAKAYAQQSDFVMTSEVVAVQDRRVVVRNTIDYEASEPAHWHDIWILDFDEHGLCVSYEGCPVSRSS